MYADVGLPRRREMTDREASLAMKVNVDIRTGTECRLGASDRGGEADYDRCG